MEAVVIRANDLRDAALDDLDLGLGRDGLTGREVAAEDPAFLAIGGDDADPFALALGGRHLRARLEHEELGGGGGGAGTASLSFLQAVSVVAVIVIPKARREITFLILVWF